MKKTDASGMQYGVAVGKIIQVLILAVAFFTIFANVCGIFKQVTFADEPHGIAEESNSAGEVVLAGFGAESNKIHGCCADMENTKVDKISQGKAQIKKVSDEVEEVTETIEEFTVVNSEEYIVDTSSEEETDDDFYWDGPVLNSYIGTIEGPSGKETYYNLPMGGVIDIMRNAGFSEEEYPYWVRDDGCKMLGDYIMVAADLSIRPRGSLVDCSLGKAIVCDTGEFIYSNPYQLDIAVTW